jgi:hypothetical protein
MTSSAFLFWTRLWQNLIDDSLNVQWLLYNYTMTSLLSNNKNVDDLLPLVELVSSLPAAVRHAQGEAEAIQIDKISMISRLRVELPLANQLY